MSRHPRLLPALLYSLVLAFSSGATAPVESSHAASGNIPDHSAGTANDQIAVPSRAVPALADPPSAAPAALWSAKGCTAAACHGAIEAIREPPTQMFRKIAELGRDHGDPDGCIVCHGGDPRAKQATAAHRGAPASLSEHGGPDGFYPDPASPWVNERSCGLCHAELVAAQFNSLMMTEAGKAQGTLWSFGKAGDYQHRYANYAAKNPGDPAMRLGSDAYRNYMRKKSAAHPDLFVQAHEPIPEALGPTELGKLESDPGAAVYTYLRAECQRCHLGVKGRARRGDFRGMGCGACHIPYSNNGFYEGADASIAKDEAGHALVHTIQATRNAKVRVGSLSYSGIPVETCTTCHNRGKRIGVSYQGLMEGAFGSPFTEGGGGQIGLHSKHYIAMEQDVHYQAGMLCQDCHTSRDVHGDGFLAAANLAAVEIECSDCHGTPGAFPWELPLGWGDEDGPGAAQGPPRGVAPSGVGGAKEDHLISARGNPFPELLRIDDRVLLRSAGGKDLWLDPLKKKVLAGSLSLEA